VAPAIVVVPGTTTPPAAAVLVAVAPAAADVAAVAPADAADVAALFVHAALQLTWKHFQVVVAAAAPPTLAAPAFCSTFSWLIEFFRL